MIEKKVWMVSYATLRFFLIPRDLNYLTVVKLQVWRDVTMEMAAVTRKNFSPGLKLELAALQL